MEARNKIVAQVEKAFRNRMSTSNIKPGSAVYKKAKVEFFVGAMAGMHAIAENGEFKNTENLSKQQVAGLYMPPTWVFGIMRGDDFEIENVEETL